MGAPGFLLLTSGLLAMLPLLIALKPARSGHASISWRGAACGTAEPFLFSVLISIPLFYFFDPLIAASFLSGTTVSLLTALAARRIFASFYPGGEGTIRAALTAVSLALGPALAALGAVLLISEGNEGAVAGFAGGWAGALYLGTRLRPERQDPDPAPDFAAGAAASVLHRSADLTVIVSTAVVIDSVMKNGSETWVLLLAAFLAAGVITALSGAFFFGIPRLNVKAREGIVWGCGIAGSAAAFMATRLLTANLRSADLWQAGVLDRTGPFWAVSAGIFMPLIARQAVLYYRRNPEGKGLLCEKEKWLLPVFFAASSGGLAYFFAGLYGIVLAGAGCIAVLMLPADLDDHILSVTGSLLAASAGLAGCAALAGIPLPPFRINSPAYFFSLIPAGALTVLALCAFGKRFPSDRREAYPSLCILLAGLCFAAKGLDPDALSGFLTGTALAALLTGFHLLGSTGKTPSGGSSRAALDCGSLLRTAAAMAMLVLLMAG